MAINTINFPYRQETRSSIQIVPSFGFFGLDKNNEWLAAQNICCKYSVFFSGYHYSAN